ncbi:MAG TPA: hypothetical protein VN253_19375 [Kofleriaceae bacterium]|nr:hypothetical protein [Kofleriaceae bacterium]
MLEHSPESREQNSPGNQYDASGVRHWLCDFPVRSVICAERDLAGLGHSCDDVLQRGDRHEVGISDRRDRHLLRMVEWVLGPPDPVVRGDVDRSFGADHMPDEQLAAARRCQPEYVRNGARGRNDGPAFEIDPEERLAAKVGRGRPRAPAVTRE